MIQELEKGKARLFISIGGREDRKRYSKTVTYKTKKELKNMHDEFERECEAKANLTDITIRQLLDFYIAHCKTFGRKKTTIYGYEVAAERLSSSLQSILAYECTTYRLDEEIALMSDKGHSAKTIKNTIGLLSSAYRYAIRIGKLKENPCERVGLPKGQQREIRILHLDEIQPFINVIQDVDLNEKVAYELALFMGLRRSEILGLKESDVDIVNGMIDIHNTRHRIAKEDFSSTTKTKKSTRTLAMPEIVLIDVARLLQVHREFPYEKSDLLVQNGFGEPLSPQALSSRLVRLEKEKGLPHVTVHGLRHTYASILHSKGVDMAQISAELGHSNLATTQNTYTHIIKTPSQSSRGIASTINSLKIGDKSVTNKKK